MHAVREIVLSPVTSVSNPVAPGGATGGVPQGGLVNSEDAGGVVWGNPEDPSGTPWINPES